MGARFGLAWVVAALALAGCAGAQRGTTDEPERVTMSAPDGGVVEADEYGAGRRAVVLVHGGRYTKESWEPQAPREMAKWGYRVLAINLRGKGTSVAGSAGPEAIGADVLGAVRWARQTGSPWVAVVGASIGGYAAATASVEARPGEFDGMVLLAHSSIEEPERITVPTLFILAEHDPNAQGRPRLERIREQYERAGGPKELVLLSGEAHTQAIFSTEEGPRLMSEIERFLAAE